ncbi:hypothetical protein IWW50_006101, partial [Coemansia erecta]
ITAIQTLNHTPLVMSRLEPPRQHIYIDLCHIGDHGEAARDALVVVDSASGYMEVYPVIDQTAETIGETLKREWFEVHGAPVYLTSDN